MEWLASILIAAFCNSDDAGLPTSLLEEYPFPAATAVVEDPEPQYVPPPSKRTAGDGDSPDAGPVSRQGSLLPVTTAGGAAVGPTGLNPVVPSSVEPSGIPAGPTGEEPVLSSVLGVVFAPGDAGLAALETFDGDGVHAGSIGAFG